MGTISTVTDSVDAITAQRINVLAQALADILGVTDDAQSGVLVQVGRYLQVVDALTALWQEADDGELRLKDAFASVKLGDLGTIDLPSPLFLGGEGHRNSGYSYAAPTANTLYLWPAHAPIDLTVLGVRIGYWGTPAAGNVLVGLYSDGATLTKVAESGSTALPTAYHAEQSVYFTSAYAATKGLYWLAAVYSVGGFNIWNYPTLGLAKSYAAGGFTLPASFSKPAGWADGSAIPGHVGLVSGGIW